MTFIWSGITIDCADPERLAGFWSALLERPRSDEMSGQGWASVGSRHDIQPRLNFQQVPEPRRDKVRLHLDLSVDDLAAARHRIESLGGSWTGQQYDYPGEGTVLVMADPEGNAFCIARYLG